MHQQHIFLVLDPNFGEQASALSVTNPVWIVESAQNTPVVHNLWQQSKQEESNSLFLTLFKQNYCSDKEESFSDILITINEHHGEASFSADKAYTHLTVLGMLPTSVVEEYLADMGLQLTATFATGFMASKVAALFLK